MNNLELAIVVDFNLPKGAGKVAQWLIAFTVLAEDMHIQYVVKLQFALSKWKKE